MARRIVEIDSDMDIDAPTAPSDPVVLDQTAAIPDASPSNLGSDVANSGIYWNGGVANGGGNVLGGGVLTQTTGTYAQVNQNDLIWGTAGNDFIHGGYGDDTIVGFEGKDSLFGDAGADFINGGTGDDWLDGGTEADTLYGMEGKDTLVGGSGNDTMNGGTEDDRLFGDGGADRMTGGTGNDAFFAGTPEFGAYGQVTVAKDTIVDFHTRNGEDDILFLHEPLAMLTDFHAVAGGNALPKTAVQMGYVQFVQHGNPFFGDFGTTVYIDSNGNLPGGSRWAVAELVDVAITDLNYTLLAGQGGNLFV